VALNRTTVLYNVNIGFSHWRSLCSYRVCDMVLSKCNKIASKTLPVLLAMTK